MDDDKGPLWFRALGAMVSLVGLTMLGAFFALVLYSIGLSNGRQSGAAEAMRPYCEARQQVAMRIEKAWRCVVVTDPAKAS